MNPPLLYVFGISHYCEKARWALDYLQVPYLLRVVAPGVHIAVARKLGAPRSSVPILVAGETTIQGSVGIIDWAQSVASGPQTLTPQVDQATSTAIEQRLDDLLGVHVRRCYYSEALLKHPNTVKPLFTSGISTGQKLLLNVTWPMLRKVMARTMDLGEAQGHESARLVEAELDWLDELLGDGRPYLAAAASDGQFSRLDVTAASLLAPIALPPEHPTYGNMVLPPGISQLVENWQDRPIIRWVRDMYARHRNTSET